MTTIDTSKHDRQLDALIAKGSVVSEWAEIVSSDWGDDDVSLSGTVVDVGGALHVAERRLQYERKHARGRVLADELSIRVLSPEEAAALVS